MALLALAGCGDPAELSQTDAETLGSARERLDDALETAEIVRTDKGEARRLRREVLRYPSEPARLKLLVPSLVTVTGTVYPPAYRSFVQYATTNATRALYPPAAREVERMVSTLDEADAKSKITTLDDQTADAYLAEATRDTQPIWPELARVLRQSREEL